MNIDIDVPEVVELIKGLQDKRLSVEFSGDLIKIL